MQKKIQNSVFLILTITLLVSYLAVSLFVYRQNVRILKESVRGEGRYIALLFSLKGEESWQEVLAVSNLARITRLDGQGYIEFDASTKFAMEEIRESLQEGAPLSRIQREEVEQAFRYGYGEAVRISETLGVSMYYYAILLADGSVIRVAQTMESLTSIALRFMPITIGIYLLMILLTWLILRWRVARLIQPINQLDLEKPLENETYEELLPLLQAIDQKHSEFHLVAEMRKEFSANVSHELKTPLTSISGYAELIKSGIAKAEDIPEFSERIFKEARRLLALIDDIIRLSRLDEGNVDVEKEECNLYELCREVVTRLSSHGEQKKVHISITGESVTYVGVKHLLEEMIYNLCDNAIKYNHQGGEVQVWVGETLEGILVRVSDSGIGMTPEQQERVFERFYRVDKSHSKETGGTGLGLSIVKHVAALHDIELKMESKIGEGTRIEIWF